MGQCLARATAIAKTARDGHGQCRALRERPLGQASERCLPGRGRQDSMASSRTGGKHGALDARAVSHAPARAVFLAGSVSRMARAVFSRAVSRAHGPFYARRAVSGWRRGCRGLARTGRCL
jgi:hypothetical protein